MALPFKLLMGWRQPRAYLDERWHLGILSLAALQLALLIGADQTSSKISQSRCNYSVTNGFKLGKKAVRRLFLKRPRNNYEELHQGSAVMPVPQAAL